MKQIKMALIITVVAFLQACNSNDDSVDAAKDTNDSLISATDSMGGMSSTDTTAVTKDDADFAVEAANGGMMEVQLGNYAMKNASSQRVKDFGAMIAKDHSQANEELKSIASSKNIVLPTFISEDVNKDMLNIMEKKGRDFDKAYMKMMVDDHENDIRKFEKASNDCKDPALKNFASKTLPALKAHLESAKAIVDMK